MGNNRTRIRKHSRHICRRPLRVITRASVRSLPGFRRRPDDLAQVLTAFRHVIRCQRSLARLAPRFFDSAVVEREARERAEQRRWMATWEPALAQAYGREPGPDPASSPLAALPPLPGPRTQRAVERELAERAFWMSAGDLALQRHQQRRPHALPSLGQIARLLQLGFDLQRLACGLDDRQPTAAPLFDMFMTNLQRTYGSRKA